MTGSIKAYANCDHAWIVWRYDQKIPKGAGFALYRQRGGEPEEPVYAYVGWDEPSQPLDKNKGRPSNEWPLQEVMWADYLVKPDQSVRYRVVPLTGTKDNLTPLADQATDWTPQVKITADCGGGLFAYFNRGIVATQAVAHRLPKSAANKALLTSIETVGDSLRGYLSGELLKEMVALLRQANDAGHSIYAALFELNDPELIPLLISFGPRAHVVLANGAAPHRPKRKPGDPPPPPLTPEDLDENYDARQELNDHHVDVHDRMVSRSQHLAHNKFVVFCDDAGKASMVWTGSTNWTKTGLCTQANNGLLVRDTDVADWYLGEWNALVEAENGYPKALKTTNTARRDSGESPPTFTVWFAPVNEYVDMADARALINGASQGILFAMFNPGPVNSLYDTIMARRTPGEPHYDPDLYIRGTVNEDFSEKFRVAIVDEDPTQAAPLDVVLPENIHSAFSFWAEELKKLNTTHAMVHSKCIVLDPFGAHPVVMTGSHNMGEKASRANDDNLLIVQGQAALAAAYAVNLFGVYRTYRWRYGMARKAQEAAAAGPAPAGGREAAPAVLSTFRTLHPGTHWQDYTFLDATHERELKFWLGEG